MLWEDLREEEFKEAIEKSKGVCILPVGCLEKHGQHLPVGTDVIHITEIAKISAQKEYAVVFPTIYAGEKTGAQNFKGTVVYSSELRQQLLKETCKEIARNGFKKILIYNGHGGNQAMISNLSRSLLYENIDFCVFDYSLGSDFATPKKLLSKNYPYLTSEDRKILNDYTTQKKRYGHACFIETGWVYGVRPETVRLDKINQESGESEHRFDEFSKLKINTPLAWMADYPNSYAGDSFEGMNERIAMAMVEYSSECLCNVIKFLKKEKISLEYLSQWKKMCFEDNEK